MKLKKGLVWIICLDLIAFYAHATTREEQLELASSYSKQVVQYYQQGQFDNALPLAEKALKIRTELLGEQHPDTLKSLSELAVIYKSVGRLKEALPLFEKGYRLSEQVLGEQHPNTLNNLKNVVAIYQSKGSFLSSKTLPLSKKSYRLRKKVLIENETFINLNNLAYAYTAPNQIDKAVRYFEQSVDNVERLRHSNNLSAENRRAIFKKWLPGYFKLSQLYLMKAHLNEAFQTAEKTKARTLLDSMVMKLAAQKAGLSLTEQQQFQHYQNHIAVLNDKIAKEADIDNLLALEMTKNQLVRQAAYFHRSLMQKYPKYAQLNDFQIVTAATGGSLIPSDALFISYLVQDNQVLVFTLDSMGDLQAKDLGKIPHFEQSLKRYHYWLSKCNPQNFKFKCEGKRVWKVAKHHFKDADKVRDGETWEDEKTGGKWKVWKIDEDNLLLLIGKKPPRDNKPKRLRKNEFSRYFDKSRELAQQLLKPFQARLQGKERLIISPDGALALIPFETFILNDKPLIATHQVSYVQSLSVLALLKEREREYRNIKNRGTLLAMGAARHYLPDKKPLACRSESTNESGYTSNVSNTDIETMPTHSANSQRYQEAFKAKGMIWCDLPHSETELNKLAALFKDKQPLIYKKSQASEVQLRKLNENKTLTRYQYLVFSTHGYFDEDVPALSAIVLDQLNLTDDTDGFITASEWAGYDLRSDLMVLSGGETGTGKVMRGEGLMGLPYAFYVAGNKNTLMTLWAVSDKATAEFIVSFFKKLKNGQTQIEALTNTKREFLNSEEYKQPLYWAPFVLYGI